MDFYQLPEHFQAKRGEGEERRGRRDGEGIAIADLHVVITSYEGCG